MLNLESLNEAQQQAVTFGEGPLLVLAGPGSGKTTVVIQRIFYLLEERNIPPEKILVLTFTKDAAWNMRKRFLDKAQGIQPVRFGTFHSVFYHILQKSHILKSHQILSETQKSKLLFPIVKKYNQENQDISDLLSAMGYFKNTGELEEAKRKLSPKCQENFESIFLDYENVRHEEGTMDFDDMVYECRILLQRNKSLREYWQNQFDYILLDEFQDISPTQYEVIKLLTKKPYNLFAVGDDDQAIYGFRGAQPECLKRFEKDFKSQKVILNQNYRSKQGIVDASSKMIKENKKRFPKDLCAHNKERGRVIIRSFDAKEGEYDYLKDNLLMERENATCAVLFRTNSKMQQFAAILSREGIEYSMKEKVQSIYEHFIVKDIMAYLQLACGEWNRELFLQIMNKPYRGVDREFVGGSSNIKQMICKANSLGFSQAARAIEKLENQFKQMRKFSPYLAVQYVCKVMRYEAYIKETAKKKPDKYTQWREVLCFILEDAGKYNDLSDWKEAQQSYNEQQKEGNLKEGSNIILMTAHGAKGLEFDKVWIPDCNEGIFPYGQMLDEEACEEERRIFYVAMTRAKSSLELLYLNGTKEQPRLPSRFLNPLLK